MDGGIEIGAYVMLSFVLLVAIVVAPIVAYLDKKNDEDNG